jgi:hypothetical protein
MRWLYGRPLLLLVPCLLCVTVRAQEPPPGQPPTTPPTTTPQTPPVTLPQEPGTVPPVPGLPEGDEAHIEYGELKTFEKSKIVALNVVVTMGEYTLSGDRLEGDFEGELVFTGNPRLTYRGQTLTGDAIHFNPKTKAYRVDNLRTALSPDFLQGRIATPLYLSGQSIFGIRRRPIFGEDIDATTCDKVDPDYLIRAGEVKVEPGKRVTLRRATLYLWGKRLLTLPTLVIPLDRRPRSFRTEHLPRVGRSVDEGWFVKQSFDYFLADRVPGVLRLDLMEKKGFGIGIDQGWNLLRSAGAFVLYTIPTSGFNRNLALRLNNRQNIGGGQTLTLDNDIQKNSYYALPATTNFNTRLGYSRIFGGMNTTLNFGRMATDSGGFGAGGGVKSRNYTLNVAQGITLNRTANANFNADYSRYSTVSGPNFTRTEQLSTRMQADQRASNYLLQLSANKNIPVGQRQGQSFFGGVEKLPEITLSNYRFTNGYLSTVPANFTLSAGKYSEGSGFTNTGASNVSTERVIAGFDINNTRYTITPRTDLNVSAGFQQYFYGDGSAQYILRNNTTLSQRWLKRSGLNINYTYQQPQGGTPFRFDQQGRYHALNADLGVLDDRRVQLTARVGYDLSQSALSSFHQPWQTLSANILVRPVDWARFRSLLSFDPNTGKFVSATADLRFRGRNEFAWDIVGRYDPRTHKFGQINSYINLPIGKLWRVIGLVQYNGYLNRFESRNIQIIHDLHCMEASITYIDNPFGFRNDKQIFFNLRIKAFPLFQRFGVGQFGQAIDTSVGEIY